MNDKDHGHDDLADEVPDRAEVIMLDHTRNL